MMPDGEQPIGVGSVAASGEIGPRFQINVVLKWLEELKERARVCSNLWVESIL